MKSLSVMIKPASSLCNMRCRYCFYADASNMREVQSYGFMSERTAAMMIDNIFRDLDNGDEITFAFQGGEPMLAELGFYESFIRKKKKKTARIRVNYTIQTNGILLDNDWCDFFKRNGFLVGLSLDGPAEWHNENRPDVQKKGTFTRVMNAKRMLDAGGVDYNILCVLTHTAARHPQRLWRFILDTDIRYIQFVPCFGGLDGQPSPYVLRAEMFASFYGRLYDLWLQELEKGNRVSVKLFDDVIGLFAFGTAPSCGFMGGCRPQYVIEADGSVYPCDFYVLDEYRLGNISEKTLRELFAEPGMQDFLQCGRRLPAHCADCEYAAICAGGCRRMAGTIYADGLSEVCGFRLFLKENASRILNAYQKYQNR